MASVRRLVDRLERTALAKDLQQLLGGDGKLTAKTKEEQDLATLLGQFPGQVALDTTLIFANGSSTAIVECADIVRVLEDNEPSFATVAAAVLLQHGGLNESPDAVNMLDPSALAQVTYSDEQQPLPPQLLSLPKTRLWLSLVPDIGTHGASWQWDAPPSFGLESFVLTLDRDDRSATMYVSKNDRSPLFANWCLLQEMLRRLGLALQRIFPESNQSIWKFTVRTLAMGYGRKDALSHCAYVATGGLPANFASTDNEATFRRKLRTLFASAVPSLYVLAPSSLPAKFQEWAKGAGVAILPTSTTKDDATHHRRCYCYVAGSDDLVGDVAAKCIMQELTIVSASWMNETVANGMLQNPADHLHPMVSRGAGRRKCLFSGSVFMLPPLAYLNTEEGKRFGNLLGAIVSRVGAEVFFQGFQVTKKTIILCKSSDDWARYADQVSKRSKLRYSYLVDCFVQGELLAVEDYLS